MKIASLLIFLAIASFSYCQKEEPVFVKASVDTASANNLHIFFQKAFRIRYFKYFEEACDQHSYLLKFRIDSNNTVSDITVEGKESAMTEFLTQTLHLTSGCWRNGKSSKLVILPVIFNFTTDCDPEKKAKRINLFVDYDSAIKRDGLLIDKITNDEIHLKQIVFRGFYVQRPWDFSEYY